MTAPLRRQQLASYAAALRAGGSLDADGAAQLADAFDQIAAGVPADVALGLRLKPGQHQSAAQIAARDQLLRLAALRFWPDVGVTEQARHLALALGRYHAGRWQRERSANENPHRGDTLAGYLWQLLRLRDRCIGERQIARALVSDICYRLLMS